MANSSRSLRQILIRYLTEPRLWGAGSDCFDSAFILGAWGCTRRVAQVWEERTPPRP